MQKRFFWGVSVNPDLPARIDRFRTRRELEVWISQDPEYRGRVTKNHPCFWVVRRIQRMMLKERVFFPVLLSNHGAEGCQEG